MACKQVGTNRFSFTVKTIPPQNKWGDDPFLDQLGTTMHLTPTTSYVDQEVLAWINENTEGIIVLQRLNGHNHISFKNEDDAMRFKLTWL